MFPYEFILVRYQIDNSIIDVTSIIAVVGFLVIKYLISQDGLIEYSRMSQVKYGRH